MELNSAVKKDQSLERNWQPTEFFIISDSSPFPVVLNANGNKPLFFLKARINTLG